MKKLIKSGLAFFAVSFLTVNANAQLASDSPAPQAAKTTVTTKPVTASAVQTASSMPATVAKQQGTVNKEVSKTSAKTPGGVEIVTTVGAKTTTVKPISVISDQGGVKPVMASEEVGKATMPIKLETAPAAEKVTPVEQKVTPGTTDTPTKTKTN